MNYWNDEHMAEYHRQVLLNEAKQIQLEKLARSSHVQHPGLFTRTMFNFANWMITTGKQLRRRYEIPCVNRTQTPSGSFAR